jgi:hypothetical protein
MTPALNPFVQQVIDSSLLSAAEVRTLIELVPAE